MYKIIPGLDATGDECLGNEKTGQWIDGHVDTFWAYDYPHPGTTAYYVHTRSWGVQTFWVGLKKTSWDYCFTFWAFKATPRVFPGKKCYSSCSK